MGSFAEEPKCQSLLTRHSCILNEPEALATMHYLNTRLTGVKHQHLVMLFLPCSLLHNIMDKIGLF